MNIRHWLTTIFALLLLTVAVLVTGMVLLTPTVTQPGFPETLADATFRVQEKPFNLRNADCRILIFGDSTAMTGVNAHVLGSATGMTACNIAATRPLVDALGTLPVDAFLAHNPRPKYLVVQLGPESFYRETSWEHVRPLAPIALLLRQQPGGHTVWTLASHPAQTVQFFQFILQMRLSPRTDELERFNRVYREPMAAFQKDEAPLTYQEPGETECRAPALPIHAPIDTRWIQQVRQRYQAQGIQVLIKASPVPACDPQLAFFQRGLAAFVDSNVQPLPIADFISGDRHMTAEGARTESLALAAEIAARDRTP